MKKKEIPLTDLDVLVLDCQATTANPENGHLIEIGWSRIHPVTGADNPPEPVIQSYLVRLPEDAEISRRVSFITGLKTEGLEQGLEPGAAWKKLLKTAKTITTANKRKPCPTVIHYARFEEPYLHHLHQQHSPGKPFPLQIICTHQVMRRLFPTLPRKGLRAAAGYLGHSVPELRRAAHHTSATAFVWHQAVQLLEEQEIRTLDQLSEWLASPPPPAKRNGRVFPMPPAVRLDLPRKPGIYRMLRSNGDLLYIGKATSLRNRVNSYFYKKKGGGHAEHTMEMLTQAAGLETIVTGSALEAALLESDEIKKHAPPYNVALRKRDREVAFFSRDLLHAATGTDEAHPIGPLPSPASLAPLGILGELLAAPRTVDWDNPELPPAALGSRPEYAPGGDCFNEGFQLFRQLNEEDLKILDYSFTFTKNPLLGFMTLGRKFHLRRLEELARKALEDAEADEAETEESEIPEEWVWTPEAVAKSIEGIIRHGAHLIRRARWFCLLSESSLAWNTGETAGGSRRLLILRGGAVAHREDLAEKKKIPPPPGYLRPFPVRRQNFDVITYDRMRVLTTELRRLVTGETDREVELRLSPTNVLIRENLAKALQWI